MATWLLCITMRFTKVPLAEVAGRLKTVDPNSSIIKEAKMLGISFGDE